MEQAAVIFDLGGVVLNWVPERAFEQVVDAGEVLWAGVAIATLVTLR